MILMPYPLGSEIEDGLFEVDCDLVTWLSHIKMKPRKYDCPGCGASKYAETPVYIASKGSPGFLYNLCCKKEYQGMRFRSYDQEITKAFSEIMGIK